MDDTKRLEIATFRYGVIAPVLHAKGRGQMAYFRQMAQRQLDVPHLGRTQYTVATFKAWLRAYRRFGLDGLMPKTRSDAGAERVIGPELSERIRQILAEHPRIAVAHLHEQLIAEDRITTNRVAITTLRRHVKRNRLRPADAPPKARKRFEKALANELWTLDFMHGPRVSAEGSRRPRKTYLVAAIDDHSRYVTLADFFLSESYGVLAESLKEAFARHGLPGTLYCDNGSAFSTRDLTLACARLGVALVHSRPYDSPSRGKIERFFRTVRSRFLAVLHELVALPDLRSGFGNWLEHDYHRRAHSGTGEPPLDRFMRSLSRAGQRRVTRHELDLVFYRTLTRTVRGDCTISVDGTLWEVPHEHIGRRVEIRHPEGRKHELYLFEDDRCVTRLRRVDLVDNAKLSPPIRFALHADEDDSP